MTVPRAKKPSRGFTLIELLVVIAIISILTLPGFNSVKQGAQITQDLNNPRQIGIGTQGNLKDHDDLLFAPAQSANSSVSFSDTAASDSDPPGETASSRMQNQRQRINALSPTCIRMA